MARNVIRDTAVDFSYHSFITRVGFVTKKPRPLPKIGAFWWPFDNDLWVSVGVAVVLFSLGFWRLYKLNKKAFSRDFNLGKSFAQTLKILLMKDILKWPTSWKGRVLLTSWTLFALVIQYGQYHWSL